MGIQTNSNNIADAVRVTLSKVRQRLNYAVGIETFLSVADISIIEDEVARQFIYKLDGYFWELDHLEEKEITYPTNWWEAFKAEYFPEWLRKIYPIKYTKVTIKAKAFLPEFSRQMPGHKMVIVLEEPQYDYRYTRSQG